MIRFISRLGNTIAYACILWAPCLFRDGHTKWGWQCVCFLCAYFGTLWFFESD